MTEAFFKEQIEQANSFLLEEDYASARACFEHCLTLIDDETPAGIEFLCYYHLGFYALLEQKYEEAITCFEKANELPKAAGQFWLPDQGMASALAALERHEEAIPYFLKALEHCSDPMPRIDILMMLSDSYFALMLAMEAIASLEEAWKLCDTQRTHEVFFYVAYDLSELYIQFGEYSLAVQVLETAFQEAEIQKNGDWSHLFLGNLSTAYLYDNQLEESKRLSLQLIELYNESLRIDDLTTAYTNLGTYHQRQNNFTQAIHFFQQAVELEDNELNRAIESRNLGICFFEIGDFDTALYYFQLSLETVIQHEDWERVARYHIQIADVFFAKEDMDQAIHHYESSIKAFEHYPENQDLVTAISYLGSCYSRKDDYEKGIAFQDQALAKAKELKCQNYIFSWIYNAKANIYLREHFFTEAEENYMLSFEYDPEQKDAKLCYNLGACYFLSGRYEEAHSWFQQAVQLVEALREDLITEFDLQAFDASNSQFYEYLAASFVKLNKPLDALQTIEHFKKRAFVEQGLADLAAHEVGKNSVKAEEAVLYYANSANNELLVFCVTQEALFATFLDTNLFYDQLMEAFGDQLNEFGSAYSDTRNQTSYFVKSNFNFPDWFAVVILYYLKRLKQNPVMWEVKRKNTERFASYLYDFLIKPFASFLQGKKHITIVPDRILFLLPFETLIDQQHQFFIEQFNISYLPALSLIQKTKNIPAHFPRDCMAIGVSEFEPIKEDPQMESISHPNQIAQLRFNLKHAIEHQHDLDAFYQAIHIQQFPNLPDVKTELAYIKEALPKTEIILNSPTTPQSVAKKIEENATSTYRIIHFANHGIGVPAIPELSALVFNKGDSSSRFLRADVIKQWELSCEMVNLSACETGLGSIQGGTGNTGLVQSFFIAGVHAIQVSLWEIHDVQSSLFNQTYYQKLKLSSWHYTQVLGDVKRDCIQGKLGYKLQNPYYWGSWVLFCGSTSPENVKE